MEDLNKIDDAENAPDTQNDSKKEMTKPTVVKRHHGKEKKIKTEPNEIPIAADLTNATSEATSIPADNAANKTNNAANKTKKLNSKKGAKAVEKIAVEKSPKKRKAEIEIMAQNGLGADSEEKHDSGKIQKKTLKIVKKKAEKAEEKVDKLKKKIKKAKKKDVKPGKLKGLKEKLEKAYDKLKISLKKLKKAKKH
jgi:hypothetical protein